MREALVAAILVYFGGGGFGLPVCSMRAGRMVFLESFSPVVLSWG